MAATAASAAAAALAALSTFAAFAALALTRNLTLLSARLDAGAGLAPGRGSLSAHCRLCRAWADIPVALAPFMIPIVLTTIAITITPIAPIAPTSFCASFGASAITVTAPLTAFGPARLPGMLPPAVATPLATASRAVS
jgi:hypothetical protein